MSTPSQRPTLLPTCRDAACQQQQQQQQHEVSGAAWRANGQGAGRDRAGGFVARALGKRSGVLATVPEPLLVTTCAVLTLLAFPLVAHLGQQRQAALANVGGGGAGAELGVDFAMPKADARADAQGGSRLPLVRTSSQADAVARCESLLAELKYVCGVVNHPRQLDRVPLHTSLAECEDEQTSLFASCRQQRIVPTRSAKRLAASSLRTVPYAWAAPRAPEDPSVNVTLVTHISLRKIPELIRQARAWRGHVSLAVFARELSADVVRKLETIPRDVRERMDVHLLLSESYVRADTHYPFNAARNLALDNARTDFVFTADVDFVPNRALRAELRSALARLPWRERAMARKAALVVPAFEMSHDPATAGQEVLPESKAALRAALRQRQVWPFHLHKFWHGHGPTNFSRWLYEPDDAEPYRVGHIDGFEPYIVAFRHALPRYDDNFVGYGWSKCSFVKELVYAGYELYVLPESFLIHINHEYTERRQAHYVENLRGPNSAKSRFERYLRATYAAPARKLATATRK